MSQELQLEAVRIARDVIVAGKAPVNDLTKIVRAILVIFEPTEKSALVNVSAKKKAPALKSKKKASGVQKTAARKA